MSSSLDTCHFHLAPDTWLTLKRDRGEKWTVNGGAVTAQTLVNVNIK